MTKETPVPLVSLRRENYGGKSRWHVEERKTVLFFVTTLSGLISLKGRQLAAVEDELGEQLALLLRRISEPVRRSLSKTLRKDGHQDHRNVNVFS